MGTYSVTPRHVQKALSSAAKLPVTRRHFLKLAVLVGAPVAGSGLTPIPTQAPARAAAAASTPTAAPAVSHPKSGGTLRVAAKNDFSVFDPAISVDYQSWTMVFQMFDGLYYFDKDNKVRPAIAEGLPKISPDGLVYTIKLKKGVRFQNGREVEAADFKYTWERVLNPKTRSWGARYLMTIEGAADINNGNATDLVGCKIPDKYTLEIHLSQLTASFPYNLGCSPLFVVPREEVEKLGEDFGRRPVGTGAYRLEAWQPGQLVAFTKYKGYFQSPRPFIDRIEYHIGIDPQLGLMRLEKGEIDFLADGLPLAEFAKVTADPKWKPYLTSAPSFLNRGLYLNAMWPPLDDLRVRTAIGLALDRKRYIQLLQGLATEATGFLTPNVPGAKQRPPFEYNLEKAGALLRESGYANGFSTELVYKINEENEKLAPAVQADLAKVGIQVRLQPLATATYYAQQQSEKGIPMSFGERGASTPDFYDWLSHALCQREKISITRACLPQLDSLVFEAEKYPNDPEKRRALYLRAEDVLLDAQVRHNIWIPTLWGVHTPALKDFYVHQLFWWWWQDYWLDR